MDHLIPGVGDQPGQHSKTQCTKSTKISQTWWHTSVVPATWEAEVGESLESWGLEVAVSRDCATAVQPGRQSETPSQKINKNKF